MILVFGLWCLSLSCAVEPEELCIESWSAASPRVFYGSAGAESRAESGAKPGAKSGTKSGTDSGTAPAAESEVAIVERVYPWWLVTDPDGTPIPFSYNTGANSSQDRRPPRPVRGGSSLASERSENEILTSVFLDDEMTLSSRQAKGLIDAATEPGLFTYPDVSMEQEVDGRWLELTRIHLSAFHFRLAPVDTVRLRLKLSARNVEAGPNGVVVFDPVEGDFDVRIEPFGEWTAPIPRFYLSSISSIPKEGTIVEWPEDYGGIMTEFKVIILGHHVPIPGRVSLAFPTENSQIARSPDSPAYRDAFGHLGPTTTSYPGLREIPEWAKEELERKGQWGPNNEHVRNMIIEAHP